MHSGYASSARIRSGYGYIAWLCCCRIYSWQPLLFTRSRKYPGLDYNMRRSRWQPAHATHLLSTGRRLDCHPRRTRTGWRIASVRASRPPTVAMVRRRRPRMAHRGPPRGGRQSGPRATTGTGHCRVYACGLCCRHAHPSLPLWGRAPMTQRCQVAAVAARPPRRRSWPSLFRRCGLVLMWNRSWSLRALSTTQAISIGYSILEACPSL